MTKLHFNYIFCVTLKKIFSSPSVRLHKAVYYKFSVNYIKL